MDITARRRAEEEARESAARLAQYVDRSNIILYVQEVDAEGFYPVWVSDNIERITGYTVEEALARDWWARHLHSEERERALAQSGRLRREGGTLRHEYRFLRKDGSVLWIEDHLECILGFDGRPAQAAGMAGRIELEITETSLVGDFEKAAGIIRALQAAGIVFALDDFGTGYSSLRYLRYFRIDCLKIDQSFVQGLLANANDRAIVTTIIAIAKSLGMKCIAEGVEEAAQALLSLGCDEGQGYYFGCPEPAEIFARKWLQADRGG